MNIANISVQNYEIIRVSKVPSGISCNRQVGIIFHEIKALHLKQVLFNY